MQKEMKPRRSLSETVLETRFSTESIILECKIHHFEAWLGYDRCLRAADDDGAASRYTMKSVEKRSKNGICGDDVSSWVYICVAFLT